MADNFNVKNYLRENKLGAYRLLEENYVDLHPIGEAPIKPTNIYNPETNGWMDTVHNEKVGNWTVTFEYPGVIAWRMDGGDFSIYATPKWDGSRGTPIDLVNDDDEVLNSTETNEDEFGSFEEYAKTLLPHINAIYNRLVAIEKSGFSSGDDTSLNEAFDGFGGVHDLHAISDESPVTGKKKVKEALGKEGNFSLNDLVTTWDDMYGESFKDDYSGFYDKLNPNVSLTIPKVAQLWKQLYGEDFQEEYPAIVKKLSSISNMEEASMTAGKDWQYDDEVDSETGVPYTDEDHERFWDLGGAEVHSAVKSLLDDGFELKDIIDFIKSHYSSGRPETMEEAEDFSTIEPSGMEDDVDPETGIPYMDDEEGDDRIMGLGGDEISDAVQFLLDDGFDSEEIIEWFTKLTHKLEAGQAPY